MNAGMTTPRPTAHPVSFRLPLALLALALLAGGPAQARVIPLAEVVRLAAQRARVLKVRSLETLRAEHLYKSTLSGFGPQINVFGQYQHWDAPMNLDVTLPEDSIFTPLHDPTASIARYQDTYAMGLTVTQPLTALADTWFTSRIATHELEQARVAEQAEHLAMSRQVVTLYYSLVSLDEQVYALEGMKKTAAGHLTQVREFLRMELIRRDDLVRTEEQVIAIEQQLADARSHAQTARYRLALLIGEDFDARITPEPTMDIEPFDLSMEDCEAQALSRRPEMRSAAIATRAAKSARNLRYLEWSPEINALFSYTRSHVNSFTEPDVWFIGLNLQWEVWSWGRSWYELRASEVDIQRTDELYLQVQEAVRLEVRSAWLDVRSIWEDVGRVEMALAHARENLGIQLALAREQLNSTTAVLSAQEAIIERELDYISTVSRYHTARHLLKLLMGWELAASPEPAEPPPTGAPSSQAPPTRD
jgi:outer membrane protein